MSQTLQTVIPSYLYQQYTDDDDLQAFRDAYNQLTQQYVNTFNQLNLPVYTGPLIIGPLLDWVGQGIYGYPRPTLPGTAAVTQGPYNTDLYNEKNLPYNAEINTPGTVFVTTDDIYKRLLTWHFYKGDGKVFSLRWLKRRIMRFMLGTNGTAPNVDFTYQVSVTFSGTNTVAITVPEYPVAQYLKAAIASGNAELPFQFNYTFTISGAVLPYV